MDMGKIVGQSYHSSGHQFHCAFVFDSEFMQTNANCEQSTVVIIRQYFFTVVVGRYHHFDFIRIRRKTIVSQSQCKYASAGKNSIASELIAVVMLSQWNDLIHMIRRD